MHLLLFLKGKYVHVLLSYEKKGRKKEDIEVGVGRSGWGMGEEVIGKFIWNQGFRWKFTSQEEQGTSLVLGSEECQEKIHIWSSHK